MLYLYKLLSFLIFPSFTLRSLPSLFFLYYFSSSLYFLLFLIILIFNCNFNFFDSYLVGHGRDGAVQNNHKQLLQVLYTFSFLFLLLFLLLLSLFLLLYIYIYFCIFFVIHLCIFIFFNVYIFCRGADGILLVYDVNNEGSFTNMRLWMQEIHRYNKGEGEEGGRRGREKREGDEGGRRGRREGGERGG